MDWTQILNLISSVGFPIVACIALFMYVKESAAIHKQEIDELRKAIDNNTLVMQKLIDQVEDKNNG